MRIGTRFIIGERKEFADILKNYFPAGKVVIVATYKEEGDRLSRELKENYVCSVYSPDEKITEGARFFIGVGGSEVIAAVKRAADNAKYAFIPTAVDYRYLYAFDNMFTLPEFVFLDEGTRKEEKSYLLKIYIDIYQLYSELVFCSFYRSALPYRDDKLNAYIKKGEKLLRGETEREEFTGEGIRYIENVVNELYSRKTKELITEKTAKAYGRSDGEKYYVVTFLLLMTINFTTHRFRDILLPSEKTWREYENVGAEAFNADCLPDRELLKTVGKKVRFLTETTKPDVYSLIKALRASGDINPIFSIINERGITDALFYEYARENGKGEENAGGDKRILV